MFDLRFFGAISAAIVLACVVLPMAGGGGSAQVSESEMEAQRCIWRCLADARNAEDPRYQACVAKMCSETATAPARSKAAAYLVSAQIGRACGGKPGSIDPGSVIERDLTGDGRADLIIHHEGIRCRRGGRSLSCDAQGCPATLYVRRGALLHPEAELDAVEAIGIGGGRTPTVHVAVRGGKSSDLQWDGRGFRPAAGAPEDIGHPFDGFLGGLLPVCEGSPEFERFQRTLAEKYGFHADGTAVDPGRQVVVPDSIGPLIGPPAATKGDESTKVVVPLDGTFRSLALREIEFHFGNENGIAITALVFGEPIERVRAVLGREVAKGARRLKAEEAANGVPGEIKILKIDGRVMLLCDMST